MINFNFAVKSGFAPVVVNETAIGTKVRHRNNGMFFGWIKAYLTNGKMLIETLVNDEMITQMVDPEKFMMKDRNHNKMINYVCGRIEHCKNGIDCSVEQGNWDDYNFYRDKFDLLKGYLGAIIYSMDDKSKKNVSEQY